MKCWICGDEATTGEHLTKHSDLKSHFGHVSQTSPLFLHTKEKSNQRLKTIKKDSRLKSDALLCGRCNNDRTSEYDKAWEKLSGFLRQKKAPLNKGDLIKLEKVFPGSVKRSMLRVHLFFVKLFGCAIIAHDVPIDIEPFRKGILEEKSVDNVYLALWPSNGRGTGNSDIESENLGGKCAYATWFYVIGDIAVNVMYAIPGERRLGLVDSWHPSTVTKRIKIGGI